LSKKEEYGLSLGISLGNITISQLIIGALRSAESNLKLSIAKCSEAQNRHWEAVAHQYLGNLLTYCGMWNKATQELLQSEKALDEQGNAQTSYGSVNISYRALQNLVMARDLTQSRVN